MGMVIFGAAAYEPSLAHAPTLAPMPLTIRPPSANHWPNLLSEVHHHGLITRNPPVLPKSNRRRALFVRGKIDEILAWEQRKETERDTKFVDWGATNARCRRDNAGGWIS
jgi:hypothetical protein